VIGREVLPARLRPGWRLAFAMPLLVVLAAGAAELGHAAIGAIRAGATPALVQLELSVIEVVGRDTRVRAGCGHGGALVAAIAFGVFTAIVCILIGVAIARGRCPCAALVGADGDGGDEDDLDLPFDDVGRLVVIAVPRQEAPGAPAPVPGKETN